MNAAYNVLFDPSQSIPPQQQTDMDLDTYEGSAYFFQ